jgi:predicted MFS family arabinose efflux permease
VVTGALFTYVVMNAGDRATNIGRIPYAMRGAAVLAAGYAVYAFFGLPETRPASGAAKLGDGWAVARALGMLRDRSVLVLTLVAMPVAAIHTAYYLNIAPYLTDVIGVAPRYLGPTIAISQTSEVVFLFALGPLLRRFGYKTILTVGATAQAVRFLVFAWDPGAVVVMVSLALHGVAFACFFTTAILYIERASPQGVRHSAQTVFGIVLFGLGPALAGPYSEVFDHFTRNGRPDFRMIWYTQAAVALASAVVIVLLFRDRTRVGVAAGAVIEAEAAETGAEG